MGLVREGTCDDWVAEERGDAGEDKAGRGLGAAVAARDVTCEIGGEGEGEGWLRPRYRSAIQGLRVEKKEERTSIACCRLHLHEFLLACS